MSQKSSLKSDLNNFVLIGPGKVGITFAHLLKPYLKLVGVYGRSQRRSYDTKKWLN